MEWWWNEGEIVVELKLNYFGVAIKAYDLGYVEFKQQL